MRFKKLDFLSPHITLFFNGEIRHSSVLSAIFTIITYTILAMFSIFFLADVFIKTNPTIYFYQKYFNYTGRYFMKPEGLFHFLTFGVGQFNIDNSKIKIVGVNLNPSIFFETNNDSLTFNHWEYGLCENFTEYQKISEANILYNNFKDIIKSSFCITRYYDKNANKFYTLGDDEFIFPMVTHGASSGNGITYGIYILINNINDLDYVIGLNYYTIHFVDNYVDVELYKNPLVPYLYNFSSSFTENSFSINHLTFSPTIVRTNDGFFLNNSKEKKAYSFTKNEKFSHDSNKNIIGSFYFWMENKAEIYQRNYGKIQEALANIGGVTKVITALAVLINRIFNDYTVISDFNQVFEIGVSHYSSMKNIKASHSMMKPTLIARNAKTTVEEKKRRITLKTVLFHRFRIQSKKLVSLIIDYRARILSEEKIIKTHLLLKLLKKHFGEYIMRKKIDMSDQSILSNINQITSHNNSVEKGFLSLHHKNS